MIAADKPSMRVARRAEHSHARGASNGSRMILMRLRASVVRAFMARASERRLFMRRLFMRRLFMARALEGRA